MRTTLPALFIAMTTLLLSQVAWALPSVGRWMLYGHAGYAISRPGKDGKSSAMLPPDRDAPSPAALMGGTCGAGAAWRATDHLLIGGEINYLDNARNLPDGLCAPAIEVGLTLKAALALTPRLSLSGGLMAGPLLAFGSDPSDARSPEWSGLGFSCQGLVSGDYFISDHIALGLDAGYRLASVGNLRLQNLVEASSLSDSRISPKYSGPILRLGVRVYF